MDSDIFKIFRKGVFITERVQKSSIGAKTNLDIDYFKKSDFVFLADEEFLNVNRSAVKSSRNYTESVDIADCAFFQNRGKVGSLIISGLLENNEVHFGFCSRNFIGIQKLGLFTDDYVVYGKKINPESKIDGSSLENLISFVDLYGRDGYSCEYVNPNGFHFDICDDKKVPKYFYNLDFSSKSEDDFFCNVNEIIDLFYFCVKELIYTGMGSFVWFKIHRIEEYNRANWKIEVDIACCCPSDFEECEIQHIKRIAKRIRKSSCCVCEKSFCE